MTLADIFQRLFSTLIIVPKNRKIAAPPTSNRFRSISTTSFNHTLPLRVARRTTVASADCRTQPASSGRGLHQRQETARMLHTELEVFVDKTVHGTTKKVRDFMHPFIHKCTLLSTESCAPHNPNLKSNYLSASQLSYTKQVQIVKP